MCHDDVCSLDVPLQASKTKGHSLLHHRLVTEVTETLPSLYSFKCDILNHLGHGGPNGPNPSLLAIKVLQTVLASRHTIKL